MKPLVLLSIEDDTGDRCVDIIQTAADAFCYRECRRDPEDGHGWRHLSGAVADSYPSVDEACAAARRDVPWLTV